MLNKYQENSLISAANVKSPLLEKNFANSKSAFSSFEDIAKGLPILIPADPTIFSFKKSDTFYLEDNEILDMYYRRRDKSYTGFKHSFYTNLFLNDFKILPNRQDAYSKIIDENQKSIRKINQLKSKYKILSAFQTRNIPHFGHEAIISELLSRSNHVVINPVIGPKKTGDLTLLGLKQIYEYVAQQNFSNKISFIPIRAQMFYAGPREAIHHAIIRERLGFDLFTVGRDHAGADGFFEENAAPEAVNAVSKTINIEVFTHGGAAYCKQCKKGLIVGSCDHSSDNMINVSGSEFRSHIKNFDVYEFADREMQNFLHKQKMDLFES